MPKASCNQLLDHSLANEMKVKGELKQGQAEAINAAADLKKGAKTAAKKAGDAADKAADKIN
ncbi:MAG: hypothetical protein ACRC1L_15550 [Prochlorococcaceae cyanobacterium]